LEGTFKGHPSPTPLKQAETSSTRSGDYFKAPKNNNLLNTSSKWRFSRNNLTTGTAIPNICSTKIAYKEMVNFYHFAWVKW